MLVWRGHCVVVEMTLCYCGQDIVLLCRGNCVTEEKQSYCREHIVLLKRGHGVTVEKTLCYCGEDIVLL